MGYNNLLLVEGSDMCGKTFICEIIKEITALDTTGPSSIDGMNYKYYKFPRYDKTFGSDILQHLKRFNPNSKSVFEEREVISNKLIINKINGLNNITYEIRESENPLAVFDRFTMSQLIYDLAWLSNKKFKKHVPNIKDYFDIKNQYAALVYCMYEGALLPNTLIKTVYCKKSIYIKCISSLHNENRRVDAYDKNTLYQDVVNLLFDYIYCGRVALPPSSFKKETVQIMYELLEIITSSRDGYIGDKCEKYVSVIDTDKMYANIYRDIGLVGLANAILDGDEKNIKCFLSNKDNEKVIDIAKSRYVRDIKEFLKSVITDKGEK